MTPDAERRFLLVLLSTGYVVALGAVWIWIAWPVAVAAAILGPLLAVLLSLEASTPEKSLAGADTVPEDGLSRRDIVRRAEGRG